MREIKFRVWDKLLCEMFEVYSLSKFDAHGIQKHTEDMYKLVLKDCELMQFTGLLGKNGVEIYEGDVLYHTKQGNVEVFYPFRNEVASFGARRLSEPRYNNTLQDMHIWEAIGNIYENKELLEQ